MTKKIPSSANLFKQLMKEEVEEPAPVLTGELFRANADNQHVADVSSIETKKIDEIISVMTQSVPFESTIPQIQDESLQVADQIFSVTTKKINLPKNHVQNKKQKPVSSTEEKRETVAAQTLTDNYKKPATAPLKQRSIYLTSEQYYKVKERAARLECDSSQIVRDALDAFFDNIDK